MTIPQNLRKYAGLDRDLAVIGVGTRAEIWDAQAWEDYLSEKESAFSETDDDAIPGII
ncbi:DNA-binding transcriptional regulator/RsmH inhibitor MraZ [Sinomonas atrocyanea]|nr:DNA-binding transcriptional regulator/RsmH inhibitor MraZ [Sinomonas atrocyanea]MDR6620087.1 DNA-binding transcriptional regulator/RsmH inhibitor MraZ [Sinomonas atrocyanea]